MSDTPRTDNAWNKGFDPVILSAAQLARRLRQQCAELERENAALRKQLEQWNQSTEWFAEWAEKKEDLERELAALREQVRRLEQDLAITRQLRCHEIVESEKEDV